jgi:hypothetical protein
MENEKQTLRITETTAMLYALYLGWNYTHSTMHVLLVAAVLLATYLTFVKMILHIKK